MRATNQLEDILQKDVRSNINLSLNEFGILELLYHKGDQTTRSITDRILVAKSSTTYIIDCLISKGYVERIKTGDDRRVTYISLTAAGRDLISNYFPKHVQLVNQAFSDLEEEALQELQGLLKQVRHSFDDHSSN